MTIDPDILSRVHRGIEWLDKEIPDWLWRIDLDDLVMCDNCNCILGQLKGSWMKFLDKACYDWGWSNDHGFSINTGFSYKDLANAWRSEILRLRVERSQPYILMDQTDEET